MTAGSRELTVSERTREGSELRADASVLLVVPERKAEAATNPVPPLAVLTPDTPSEHAPLRLLQPPPPVGLGAGAHLGLDAVQYDDHGAISFAGGAPPAAPVRVYVDNRRVGDATADSSGRWALVPTAPITPGRHRVRVDQLNANGRVTARVELPFSRETAPESTVAQGRVVVQPGETLWRLARHVYGSGMRYTVIYQANRDQIRDPRLIYPGQTFAVPGAPEANTPPAKPG
jgi:nucleoid-associated protein YgaU